MTNGSLLIGAFLLLLAGCAPKEQVSMDWKDTLYKIPCEQDSCGKKP